MPLSEKTRIEVYLPDVPKQNYQELLASFDREFTHGFGGCTIIRGLEGSFLARRGARLKDRINLIYTDMPLGFDNNFELLSRYVDQLRIAAFDALEEEVVLVVAYRVFHAE